jgi:hypothetical protein
MSTAQPEDGLELGPGWRRVERGLGWARRGATAWLVGFPCLLAAAALLLPDIRDEWGRPVGGAMGRGFLLIGNLVLGLGGLAWLVARFLCLRVPTGTGARPLVIASLAAHLVAWALGLIAAGQLWEGSDLSGAAREPTLLTAFAFLLAAWVVSLLTEFLFLASLRRVGRFLRCEPGMTHARRAAWLLAGYAVAALGLGATLVVVRYQELARRIAALNFQAQPRSWLLTRIADALLAPPGTSNGAADRFFFAILNVLFWVTVALEYRAALGAVVVAVAAGLAPSDPQPTGSIFEPGPMDRR